MNNVMQQNSITEGKCSGCHGCYSICPQKAIEMKPDAEGFLYPKINHDLCVECGLCRAVCPINQKATEAAVREKNAYAAINRNDSVRMSSSSGGIFSLLAQQTISRGGAVYGAAFDESFCLKHQRSETSVTAMQTSKYVQSCVGDVFAQVEEDLKAHKEVLFTGTPCQIAGLSNYLSMKQINTEQLCLVDLICHGVPSPLVWEQYLQSISSGRTVNAVNFRDKSLSWSGFSLAVFYTDGTQYKALASEDIYMRGFFANLTLRPSCYACAQKTIDRASDLTLADCWGIDNFLPEMNDGKGTSAIIVHSAKGKQFLQSIGSEMHVQEIPTEKVLRYNRAMQESAQVHPRRDLFFRLLENGENVADAIAQALKPTWADRIKKTEVAIKRLGKKLLYKANRT